MLSLIYKDAGWADDYTFNSGMRLRDGTFFRTQIGESQRSEWTLRWGINSREMDITRNPHGFKTYVLSSDDGTGYMVLELTDREIFANMGGYIRCVKIK